MLFQLFSSLSRLISYIVLVIIATGIWWYFTDITIIFGNYGPLYAYTDIGLSLVMIVIFPLFLVALFYKSYIFGKRTNIDQKTTVGILGGIIGTLISGASCCGATLAASLGLLPILTFLPYEGLELKIISAIGLIYATWDIMRHLQTCKVKR